MTTVWNCGLPNITFICRIINYIYHHYSLKAPVIRTRSEHEFNFNLIFAFVQNFDYSMLVYWASANFSFIVKVVILFVNPNWIHCYANTLISHLISLIEVCGKPIKGSVSGLLNFWYIQLVRMYSFTLLTPWENAYLN